MADLPSAYTLAWDSLYEQCLVDQRQAPDPDRYAPLEQFGFVPCGPWLAPACTGDWALRGVDLVRVMGKGRKLWEIKRQESGRIERVPRRVQYVAVPEFVRADLQRELADLTREVAWPRTREFVLAMYWLDKLHRRAFEDERRAKAAILGQPV